MYESADAYAPTPTITRRNFMVRSVAREAERDKTAKKLQDICAC